MHSQYTLNTPTYMWDERALDFANTATYDDHKYRLIRYNAYRYSYANLLYTSLFKGLLTLRYTQKLYKYVRGIYNPTNKLVETIASYLYGGAIDTDYRGGALPVVTKEGMNRQTIVNGLNYLSRTSNFRQLKKNYATWCSNLGDAFFVVHDDLEEGFVKLSLVQPDKVINHELDSRGNVKSIRFTFTKQNDLQEEINYIYDMDLDYFSMYRSEVTVINNDLMQLEQKPSFELIDKTPNPYGFVPVVHQPFTDLGTKYGGNAYFSQFHQIHQLNDILSVVADGIRKDVDTVYAGENITAKLKGSTTSQGRDEVKIINLPSNAKLTPLTSDLDISATASFVYQMVELFESAQPVLALQAIRNMSIITEPAIAAAYGDSITRIEDMQNILDSGFERAIAMGLAIASYRGYINGFDLNYGQDGDLGWMLDTRPVISKAVDASTMINALAGADVNNPLLPVMLRMMNVSEEEIKTVAQHSNDIRSQQASSQLVSASRARLDELRTAGRNRNQQRLATDTTSENQNSER